MRSSSKRCSWLTSRAPEEAHDSLRLPWLVAVPPDGWDLAMTKLGRIVGEKKGGGVGGLSEGHICVLHSHTVDMKKGAVPEPREDIL